MSSRSDIVTVGLVQMKCVPDRATNLRVAETGIREAAKKGASIICLPELFLGPYFCQTEDHTAFADAEPVPGPVTAHFELLASELGVSLLLSLFEKRTEGLYHNTLAVLDPERGYLGKYRKMHIPDDPLYYEKFYFAPGDLGFKVFETGGVRAGTLVCWDQWYPEAARLTVLMGAQILFYPTAIGWHPHEKDAFGAKQHEAWQTVQRSHAVANGCFVVAVNRHGFEPTPSVPGEPDNEYPDGIQFWGRSFVAAPDGSIIAEGADSDDAVIVCDLDLGQITEMRTGWPFFRDRRIDAYAPLTKRFIDDD
ncbi:MAG: carbon-nitrogen hydrolase [Rhodothermales bacterium]|nr:carbon-nitrogen hydrolase [Rhodothermales bacterium]